MKKKTAKSKPDTTRILLIILCIFLALVLAALIMVAVAQRYLDLINKNVNDTPMSSDEYQQWLDDQTELPSGQGETIPPEDITWTEPSIEQSEEVINILLIGQDRREGQSRQRSDAMILCTINPKTKTMMLTSFMRDLYVQIPSYNPNKMNACYMIGGMSLLADCVEANFGIHVDGCVEVDFSGFMDLVDLVGGVDIELNQDEADYLNRRGNWDFNNASAGAWNLKAGVNHLNGEQAFAYSRIRYVGNGDFERTERQRKVVMALVEQSRDLSLSEINKLLESALPMLTTNLSNLEMMGYTARVFPMLKDLQMQTQRVPMDGTWNYAVIGDLDVVRIIDMESNLEMLQKTVGETETDSE